MVVQINMILEIYQISFPILNHPRRHLDSKYHIYALKEKKK
jgi:hypothetical protein